MTGKYKKNARNTIKMLYKFAYIGKLLYLCSKI